MRISDNTLRMFVHGTLDIGTCGHALAKELKEARAALEVALKEAYNYRHAVMCEYHVYSGELDVCDCGYIQVCEALGIPE